MRMIMPLVSEKTGPIAVLVLQVLLLVVAMVVSLLLSADPAEAAMCVTNRCSDWR